MTDPELTQDALAGIGTRLRNLRQARGLNLHDLADLSGVPPSTISKIENLRMNPSLVHAINLARALDENLGFLIRRNRETTPDFSVVRSSARPRMDLPEMSLGLEDLHGDFERGVLEARLGVIGPGASSGEEPMRHEGEELCHVLSGAIRYSIEGEIVDLGPGDTLQFVCEDAHRWQNTHNGETRVVWVFSDKLSF
ncbi:MAG: XRE family transcriptional regulator [Pseudomonadota bacterium]